MVILFSRKPEWVLTCTQLESVPEIGEVGVDIFFWGGAGVAGDGGEGGGVNLFL